MSEDGTIRASVDPLDERLLVYIWMYLYVRVVAELCGISVVRQEHTAHLEISPFVVLQECVSPAVSSTCVLTFSGIFVGISLDGIQRRPSNKHQEQKMSAGDR